MINHVSIGVREIGRARRFYDAALGPLGYRCLSEGADSLGYGRGWDRVLGVGRDREGAVRDPRI